MPFGRLVGFVLPSGAGTIVSLAEWVATVLGAVWVVALLADQAGRERRWGARITWGLIAIVSVGLLIVAFTRQEGLLERGLTFTAVSLAILAGVFVSRWRRRSVPEEGPIPRTSAEPPSEVAGSAPTSDQSPAEGSRSSVRDDRPQEADDGV
jgi:hypothetical protein